MRISIREIMESILSVALGSESGSIIPNEIKSSFIESIYFSVNSFGEILSSSALAIILSSTSVIFLM